MQQGDINRVVCKPRERGHGEPEIGIRVIREVELKTKTLTPDVFIQEFWIDENTGNAKLEDSVWITISEIPSLIEALREIANIKD